MPSQALLSESQSRMTGCISANGIPSARCGARTRSLPLHLGKKLRYLLHILIASAGHVYNNHLVTFHLLCMFDYVGNSVSRFEGRDNALISRKLQKRFENFVIGRVIIRHPPNVPKIAMLRANCSVVQSG